MIAQYSHHPTNSSPIFTCRVQVSIMAATSSPLVLALVRAAHRSRVTAVSYLHHTSQSEGSTGSRDQLPRSHWSSPVLAEVLLEPGPQLGLAQEALQHVDDGGALLVGDGVEDGLDLLGVLDGHGDGV